MTPPLARLGAIVGPNAARSVLIATAVVLLIVVLGIGRCAYDRSIIARHEAAEQARVIARSRQADARAAAARQAANAAIATDAQEIQNALAPFPDTGLAPRQRARACAILLRQAREAGHPAPAGC